MASLGQIIFCSMATLIILFSGLIILILALTFSHHASLVMTVDTFPIANLGHDHLLSCQMVDTQGTLFTKVSVTWEKTGQRGFVYRYFQGAPYLQDQNPEFEGRVNLFPDALSSGNASLLLRSVRAEDDGVYTCTVDSSSGGGKVNIELKTAAYEAPTVTFSEGTITAWAGRWFPKPQLTWTDHNRKVLQASTSMDENSAGIFSVVSSLPEAIDDEMYTLRIETDLAASISRARITDQNISVSTYLSFNGAPSIQPGVMVAITCIYFLM